ncbi:MAG: hypothetical protein EZS28_018401, partial [Streblomastix strix]
MFSKVSDRQRSDGAATISQSTKHQNIEALTSAVSASYGLVSVLARSLLLFNRTSNCVLAGGSLSYSKVIISGLSAGIIAQAKQVSNDLDLFNQTTFKSYRKSVIQSYKYNEEQFLVSTGNSLNTGLSQFKYITPEKVMGSRIRQKYSVVAEAAATASKGTSINTPQWRLPQTIFSNGETVTLLLAARSDKELDQITACSLAQIDVSHNLVLSLHTAIYQNGPQTVENPNQNLSTSSTLYFYVAYFISVASAVVAVSVPLKFVLEMANSILVNVPFVNFNLFNYIPIVLAGMVIVQLTQQVQTQQQVALPLTPNGARVYLVPPEVKIFLGQSWNSYLDSGNDQASIVNVFNNSFSAEYDETLSQCDAFDKRAKQSEALNDFWLKNFGSKILYEVTSAAKWVAPVLQKVMDAVSGPL